MLLDAFSTTSALERRVRVMVAQPRRLAAMSLASRVAFERDEGDVGESVGYQVTRRQARTLISNACYCSCGFISLLDEKACVSF